MLRVVQIHKEIWGVRARYSDRVFQQLRNAARQFDDQTPRPGTSATPRRVESHRHGRSAAHKLTDFLQLDGTLEADPRWGFLSFRATSGVRYSLSLAHTEDAVCAILSTSPVGIDIEKQSRCVDKLAKRLLTVDEQSWIMPAAIPVIQVWCAKEATLKALGTGIQGGLKKITLSPWQNRPGYYDAQVAVAAPLKLAEPAVQVEIWDSFVVAIAGEKQSIQAGVRWIPHS
jgi:phosphopantetheinyl transferase (holo-ACP synthase)